MKNDYGVNIPSSKIKETIKRSYEIKLILLAKALHLKNNLIKQDQINKFRTSIQSILD